MTTIFFFLQVGNWEKKRLVCQDGGLIALFFYHNLTTRIDRQRRRRKIERTKEKNILLF